MIHLANLGYRVEADGFPHPSVDYRRTPVDAEAAAFSDGSVGYGHVDGKNVRMINGQLVNKSTEALLMKQKELD